MDKNGIANLGLIVCFVISFQDLCILPYCSFVESIRQIK
jgi:hypothetical protein